MSDYVLSCSTPVDLNIDHVTSRDISFICFHYQLGEETLLDDFGQTLPYPEFYQRMVDGAATKTSQSGVGEYLDYFSSFLSQGKDVLHICLSSGLSGDYNSANSAALIARERYPERNLLIIDSLGASSGYGLLVDRAADLRDSGLSIYEVYDRINQSNLNVHHWFYSSDLTFYVRGGRISKAAGLFGGLLNICPVLNMDNLGRLIPRVKVRSKKRAIAELFDRMVKHVEDGDDYTGKVFISHSQCLEDAQTLAGMIEQRFKKMNGKVQIFDIGSTIGCHTGPGTVALFFWGDRRVD